MNIHRYIYIYVCVHIYMHACMHVCMYVCVCIYIYIYIYIYLFVYLCMYLCMYVSRKSRPEATPNEQGFSASPSKGFLLRRVCFSGLSQCRVWELLWRFMRSYNWGDT